MRVSAVLGALLLTFSVFAAAPKMEISSPGGGEAYVVGQPQTFVYSGKTKFKSLRREPLVKTVSMALMARTELMEMLVLPAPLVLPALRA